MRLKELVIIFVLMLISFPISPARAESTTVGDIALTREGFNLTVWLSPLVALLVGGGVVYFALKAWVRRGKRFQATTIFETKEEDEKYRRRLEKELKEFPDRGFR